LIKEAKEDLQRTKEKILEEEARRKAKEPLVLSTLHLIILYPHLLLLYRKEYIHRKLIVFYQNRQQTTARGGRRQY
jgi:hypothetical protein